MVQAPAPDAPEEPLAGGVLPGRAAGRAQDGEAARRSDARERLPMLAVVIPHEEARPRAIRRGLAQLLGDLAGGGVPRHVHVDHPPRPQRDHEERVEWPEEEAGHGQEVARPDVLCVIA